MYAAIGVGKGRRDKSTGKFFSSIVYILLFIDQIQPRGIRKKLPKQFGLAKLHKICRLYGGVMKNAYK